MISQTMHFQPLLNMAIIENWLSSKCCKFVKNHFFSIILLHAYLQYLWHISAKYQKRVLKAVGGVDFTKYALLALIMANILCIGLKSPITLAKLTLWPLNSYHTYVV